MLDLNEEALAVANQWAAKAENDLENAAHALDRGEAGLLKTVVLVTRCGGSFRNGPTPSSQ